VAAFDEFVRQVTAALKSAGVSEPRLEKPPAGVGADLAMPCFDLARHQRKGPADIAKLVAGKISPSGLIGKVEASGPYINFYINSARVAQMTLEAIDKDYGKSDAGGGKTALVEFSSPNPVHPFHMGTLRSTLIGESVSRLLDFAGWKVVRLCYINDLGKQFATMMMAYQKFDGKPKKNEKPDVWMGKLYMKVHKKMTEKQEFEAYDLLRRYESGDAKIRALGKKLVNMALSGFRQDWKKLGIHFDAMPWESTFVERSRQVTEDLKKLGLIFESKGALILDLQRATNGELPSTVIRRSDGTGLYLTRDIPSAIWREDKFSPDLNIYVVGEDQSLHFRQLFKTLELLGHKKIANNSQHLSYGLVLLEGKKMSARRGWLVLWDELFAEAKEKAAREVAKRWPKMGKKEKEERAEKIAIGAVVYFILKYSPEKIVDFRWKEALAFEGASGPYLQYTHARARSILSRASGVPKAFDASKLTDAREVALIRKLAEFSDAAKQAAAALRPHLLANWLLDLADKFNEYYQAVPVLKAESKEMSAARLALVRGVAEVLKTGLWLLAMPAPEKM